MINKDTDLCYNQRKRKQETPNAAFVFLASL